jgi:hypothetical protein
MRNAQGVRRRSRVTSTAPRFAAVALVGVIAAGCGSASPSGTSASRAISADWVRFFNGKGSAASKIGLLQDGQAFASVIDAMARSSVAREASSTVQKVDHIGRSTASVQYTLFLGSAPVLVDQTGTAILQGGTWKVGDSTFCALLSVEQVRAPGCSH